MDSILKGIMKYRLMEKARMAERLVKVWQDPKPKAILFTCIDCRLVPTRFTKMNAGEMFVVRNAGNIIPPAHHLPKDFIMNEAAALEVACITNKIRHVVICGHSDCKSMEALYQMRDSEFASLKNRRIFPLRAWVHTHALAALEKFYQLEATDFKQPLMFQAETPMRRFVAYIDPDKELPAEDKLSQIHVLQQLQNVASYRFLQERLETNQLHIHALWFQIHTGEIYYFSRQAKRFLVVDEANFGKLLNEVEQCCM